MRRGTSPIRAIGASRKLVWSVAPFVIVTVPFPALSDIDLDAISREAAGELTDLLRDAASRGDIPAERLTPVVLEVLHALIVKRALLDTRRPTKKDIAAMIDEVLLPLLVR